LTIAGSDSGGGAGIQADLKTFAALGVYGTSALTAVTAQNTVGVRAVEEAPPALVAAQIDAVLEDIGADAAKTGMLSSAAIVAVTVGRIRAHGIARLVVDPVMVAKSGDRLLREDAVRALRTDLLPLALVVTPNLPEAETLAGVTIGSRADLEDAARRIAALGPRYVLIKGGHAPGDPIDILYDGRAFREYPGARIATTSTHGTGCTLSAAIVAYLARGLAVEDAVGRAKEYVVAAMCAASPIGRGHGPLHHLFALPGDGTTGIKGARVQRVGGVRDGHEHE
jgi:hydroxymethylpyrimidine/phosphomethylpyrimidine kinase